MTYSKSVQDSLYRGEAAVPEISEISIGCPNMHFIPMNLSAFGLDNNNDVFLPTDGPHGQIECAVGRGWIRNQLSSVENQSLSLSPGALSSISIRAA